MSIAIPIINPSNKPAIQQNSVKSMMITCTRSLTDCSPKNVTSEHIQPTLYNAQCNKLITLSDPEVKDSCVHIDSAVKPLSQTEGHNPWSSLDDTRMTKEVVEISPQLKKQDIVQVIPHECKHPFKSETGLQACKQSIVEQTPIRLVSHISPVTLLPSSTCTMTSSKRISHHKNGMLPSCEETHTPELTYHTSERKKGCSNSSCNTPSSCMFYVNKTHSSSRSITPNSVLSVALGHKVTPPICDCGRRTKRKLVAKAGPNEGKPFYVCPNSCGSNKSRGCGFFKWEVVQKDL